MAFQDVQVKVTKNADGTINVQIGPEGYTLDVDQIADVIVGRSKNPLLLVHQIALNLAAQGVNPRTQTPAQLKALVEAMALKW